MIIIMILLIVISLGTVIECEESVQKIMTSKSHLEYSARRRKRLEENEY